jgi:hypothetical protein
MKGDDATVLALPLGRIFSDPDQAERILGVDAGAVSLSAAEIDDRGEIVRTLGERAQ